MTAHTPGPWEAIELAGSEDVEATVAYQERATRKGSGPFYLVICEKEDGRADVAHTGNGPTSLANARLIAAAPELLEAATALLGLIGHAPKGIQPSVAGTYNQRVEALFAAIAKAAGGEP